MLPPRAGARPEREAGAGQSHLDLETLTIDREVMRIRDTLSIKYAELVYNGYWCARRASELGHCAAARCGSLATAGRQRRGALARARRGIALRPRKVSHRRKVFSRHPLQILCA